MAIPQQRPRRNARIFSDNENTSIELKPFLGGRPVKSNMRVLTLEDSLSCVGYEMKSIKRSGHTDRTFSCSQIADLSDSVNLNFDVGGSEEKEASRVRFDAVLIRQYDQQIDVNPGVSRGPAMGLGWNYSEMEPITVDDWEVSHPPRRVMKEIRLSLVERMDRLKSSGFSRREIQEFTKRSNIARNKRRSTLAGLKLHRAHNTMERLSRRVQLSLGLRKTSERELGNLWDIAQL